MDDECEFGITKLDLECQHSARHSDFYSWVSEDGDEVLLRDVFAYTLTLESTPANRRSRGRALAPRRTDYPLTGDQVHQIIDAHEDLDRLGGYQDDDFRLDVWTHAPAQSVAVQTGVI